MVARSRSLQALQHGRRAACIPLLIIVIAAAMFMPVDGGVANAQGNGGSISVTFGPNEVWSPSQPAIDQLHGCSQPTVTCVSQIMQGSGASPDAISFYKLIGWFLTDLKAGSPVRVGTVFNPWRANENYQPALLGGSPAVVLPEDQVANITTDSWSSDPMYAALKSAYPNLMFWGSGPKQELVSTAPGGGQRFIFDYLMLDGCHACATVAVARIAFDFAPDGTYLSTTQLGLAPAPVASAPTNATAD